MMPLIDRLRRLPSWAAFLAVGLIQSGLIALMVFDRMDILRSGEEVKLQTRPVDPRDFLRGDYVTLAYDISSVAAGALSGRASQGRRAAVYVRLAPDAAGFYQTVSVHETPITVTAPDVLILGHVRSGFNCGGDRHRFCERLQLDYGLEKYFVPEGEGRVLESARNQGKVAIVAAVKPSGRAAIKRLLLDGQPVYDEPLF